MASDATTFFLGFATVFGALAWGLWRLEREMGALQRRIEAMAKPGASDDAPAGPGGPA